MAECFRYVFDLRLYQQHIPFRCGDGDHLQAKVKAERVISLIRPKVAPSVNEEKTQVSKSR